MSDFVKRELARLSDELARCDREIEAMRHQPVGQPAYLTTLGVLDWQNERRLIEREREKLQRTAATSGAKA